MKKALALILMVIMVVSLCACGSKESKTDSEPAVQETETEAKEEKVPETEAPTEAPTEAAKEFPAEGEYKLFATESEGICVAADMMGMAATLTLNADGTGELVMTNDTGEKSGGDIEWELDGNKLSLTAEGETVTGTLEDGIFTVEITDGIITYFAAEGADTSTVKVMTEEEFSKAVSDALGGIEEGVEDTITGGMTGNAIADELGIYSDDSHFVMDLYGVLMSYEFDGDTITKCTGYIDAGSEEAAEYAEQNYEANDPSIESVSHKGSIVTIVYGEDAYKTLSVSSLESVFGDSKIEKK